MYFGRGTSNQTAYNIQINILLTTGKVYKDVFNNRSEASLHFISIRYTNTKNITLPEALPMSVWTCPGLTDRKVTSGTDRAKQRIS